MCTHWECKASTQTLCGRKVQRSKGQAAALGCAQTRGPTLRGSTGAQMAPECLVNLSSSDVQVCKHPGPSSRVCTRYSILWPRLIYAGPTIPQPHPTCLSDLPTHGHIKPLGNVFAFMFVSFETISKMCSFFIFSFKNFVRKKSVSKWLV